MKRSSKIALGVVFGISLSGFANVASQQKCRRRIKDLSKTYNLPPGPDLRSAVVADGGTYPRCSGLVLFREGL